MKNLNSALYAEYLKIRKSTVLFITLIFFTIIPLMIGLMMFVSKNPDIASKLGIVGTKAKLFSENDWQGYFGLLCQSMASVGLIGFGFVTSWVFGREHTDRTMKDLLALPVPRSSIVLAKFISSFVWCILLALVVYSVGILIGQTMDLPAWSTKLYIHFSKSFLGAALLTLLLCSPVAFLAGYSRGIMAPLGFVIITLILANFIGVIGLGPYFPWAIPGLFSVDTHADGMRLLPVSYIIVTLTFLIGYWATNRWWRKADHH
jgi:ABC-2 type transport system permease protein